MVPLARRTGGGSGQHRRHGQHRHHGQWGLLEEEEEDGGETEARVSREGAQVDGWVGVRGGVAACLGSAGCPCRGLHLLPQRCTFVAGSSGTGFLAEASLLPREGQGPALSKPAEPVRHAEPTGTAHHDPQLPLLPSGLSPTPLVSLVSPNSQNPQGDGGRAQGVTTAFPTRRGQFCPL